MDIGVGEYVRTNRGYIDKVDALYGMIENTIHLENQKWFDIKNIVKHSKNIIDLIEVGDFVNGYKVMDVIIDPAPSGKCVDIDSSKDSSECTLWEEDIKTILTHEQYERNAYRLEE